MDPNDAEQLARSYIDEVWNRGDVARLDHLTTADFTYHLGGQPPRDRNAFVHFLDEMRRAFPDWTVGVDQVVAGTGSVAVRWHARATHRGPFRGMPPTGRAFGVTGINVYAIEHGRIAAEWEQMDSLGMLQQLSSLPG